MTEDTEKEQSHQIYFVGVIDVYCTCGERLPCAIDLLRHIAEVEEVTFEVYIDDEGVLQSKIEDSFEQVCQRCGKGLSEHGPISVTPRATYSGKCPQ